MIEMRWLVKPDGSKVLQMRQQYDPTAYAGWPTVGRPVAPRVWSDWNDVPEMTEHSKYN